MIRHQLYGSLQERCLKKERAKRLIQLQPENPEWNNLNSSTAIRHDILDFCVRELVALGGRGEYLQKVSCTPGGLHLRYSWDKAA